MGAKTQSATPRSLARSAGTLGIPFKRTKEKKMEVTNEEQNAPRLTQADLAIAAFALAETFNAYLSRYE